MNKLSIYQQKIVSFLFLIELIISISYKIRKLKNNQQRVRILFLSILVNFLTHVLGQISHRQRTM